jgi:alpha-L-fucosidase
MPTGHIFERSCIGRHSSFDCSRHELPDAKIERIDQLGGPELKFRREADALRFTRPPPQDGGFTPAIRIKGRGLI